MSQNSNQNKNSQSGITFTFRLSETLFAVILTAGVSFGGGFTVANSQQSTGNNQRSTVNCSVQNQSTHRKSTIHRLDPYCGVLATLCNKY